MKAWKLTEPKKFASIDIDFPSAPCAREAKIRTLRMGICGTDISCYHGKFPFSITPNPGHELGVEVRRLGKGSKMLNPAMSARWNHTSTADIVMLVIKDREIAAKPKSLA